MDRMVNISRQPYRILSRLGSSTRDPYDFPVGPEWGDEGDVPGCYQASTLD